MNDLAHFKLNEPQVVGELMDGEFVIVHFETGCYYSIRETAADACSLLFAGHSVGEVIGRFVERHGGNQAEIEQAVNQFVQQLLEEGLIVPTTAAESASDVELCAVSFVAPVFEKFDDMADQLLLDPIHEIDEQGWPQRRAA